MDPIDILARAGSLATGFAMAASAFAWLVWCDSWRWRQLAAVYASDRELLRAPERRFASLVLHGRAMAFNLYRGTVTLQADRWGVYIRVRPMFLPFPFYEPLFIPFSDIQVTPRRWYSIAQAFEIETAKVPGIKLVIRDSAADWINRHSAGRFAARPYAAYGLAQGWLA